MKHISSVLLLFSFVTVAAAQEQSTGATFDGGMVGRMCMAIQKTTGAALADDGELSPLQVDSSGNLRTTGSLSWSGSTTDPSKLEDAAHSSGDRGNYMLGVIQATPSATAADGAYGSVKLDSKGVAWSRISVDSSMVGAEDNAISGGNYGFIIIGQRQDVLTTDSSTDGDAGYFKQDSLGRLWTNPWGANHTEWFKACSGSDVTGTSATEVVPATASKYKYLTAVNCTNTDATVNTRVEIVENTSSPTTIWHLNLAAVTGSDGFQFNPPIKSTSTNQNLGVTPITTSAEVRCCMVGFVSAN